MSVVIKISRRGRGVAVIEPKPLPESYVSLLDKFYESYGLRDVVWIREVDEHNRYIMIMPPTYYLPVEEVREEVAIPEWL